MSLFQIFLLFFLSFFIEKHFINCFCFVLLVLGSVRGGGLNAIASCKFSAVGGRMLPILTLLSLFTAITKAVCAAPCTHD